MPKQNKNKCEGGTIIQGYTGCPPPQKKKKKKKKKNGQPMWTKFDKI